MASHSSRGEGGCKHSFQRTVYIASHVSDIIFDTQIFPYHMEMTKMFAIHQQQEIIERYRVFHLLILATKNLFLPLKLMALKLQPMTKTLLRHSYVALEEEKAVFIISPTTHGIMVVGIQRCLLRIRQNYWPLPELDKILVKKFKF